MEVLVIPRTPAPGTIEAYISGFPAEVRDILEKIRAAIRKAAPKAEEVISYRMPAFRQNDILVWFAAFKKHIGFYPTSSGIERFKSELARYATSKGTVRFPLDNPIPYALIGRIVRFRVRENLAKAKAKNTKR